MAKPEGGQREAQSVRKAIADDLQQAAVVLAAAFYDDPGAQWYFPDEARRRLQLERVFHFYLRKLWFPHDECLVTAGVVGAATWLPPGKLHLSIGRQLLLLPGLALTLGRSLVHVLRGMAAMEADHPKESHYYLPFIGVHPEWQGGGIGGALMVPVLKRCDRESIPAYLEASAPRNRSLYMRFGFEVTEEFRLGKGSPPMWRMWRKPRQSNAS